MGSCSSAPANAEKPPTQEDAHIPDHIPPQPTHNPNDLWGNTFVIDSMAGSESIHFISKNGRGNLGTYLSFEHSRHKHLKLFDDRPWPLRIPFGEFDWDSETGEFHGWVSVKKNCGSGVKEKNRYGLEVEVTKWKYWLKFDKRFERVLWGEKGSFIETNYNCGFSSEPGDGSKETCNGSSVTPAVPIGHEEYGDYPKKTYYNAAVDPLHRNKGCKINDAAYRGITLSQLLNLKQVIHRRCVPEGWKSTNPCLRNKLLCPKDVTHYDLVEHLVKPVTISRQCSFVEIVASEAQAPQWFVSHWWGEPVLEFIKCLEGHARDRDLGLDTTYWVCAYANNQWTSDQETGNDLKKSPFYRAMKLSKGTVSILDCEVVCYSRIWFAYELFLSFKEVNRAEGSGDDKKPIRLHDTYTIGKEKDGEEIALGITDGTVAIDLHGLKSQNDRQLHFPLSSCSTALKVQLAKSIASKPQDKIRILNSVCERMEYFEYLNSEPPPHHVKYDEVDSLFRGSFACSFYRFMLTSGENMEPFRKAISLAPLSCLTLSFNNCEHFRDEASAFALSLPRSLKTLDLNFGDYIGFESTEELAVGFNRLNNLKYLKLNLSNNPLSSVDRLGEEISALTQVYELDLNFNSTKITSCDALAVVLTKVLQLEKLTLNFDFCEMISEVSSLTSSLAFLTNIKSLELTFRWSSLSNNSILELCRGIAELDDLENLFLVLSGISTAHGRVKEKLVRQFDHMEKLKDALGSI